MQQTIQISAPAHMGLYDMIQQVETIISQNRIQSKLVNVYAQGASIAPDDDIYWHHD